MAKAGLDFHDRGQMLVSRALANAGMEVIYLDTGNMAEEISPPPSRKTWMFWESAA